MGMAHDLQKIANAEARKLQKESDAAYEENQKIEAIRTQEARLRVPAFVAALRPELLKCKTREYEFTLSSSDDMYRATEEIYVELVNQGFNVISRGPTYHDESPGDLADGYPGHESYWTYSYRFRW